MNATSYGINKNYFTKNKLQKTFPPEKRGINLGLPGQSQRISPRRRGHTVEAHRSALEVESCAITHSGLGNHRRGGKEVGRFLPRSDHSSALRHAPQQGPPVGSLDNVEKLVRSIVFEPAHHSCHVIQGNTLFLQESLDTVKVETFSGRQQREMLLVAVKDQPHDAPHIVYPVGIKKVHTPTFGFGRETAQHQHAGIGRKIRLPGVTFERNFVGGIHCFKNTADQIKENSNIINFCYSGKFSFFEKVTIFLVTGFARIKNDIIFAPQFGREPNDKQEKTSKMVR